MNKAICLLTFTSVMTMLTCSPLSAERQQLTLETQIKNSDVLFEGTVLSHATVKAPTKEYALYDSTEAMEITFSDIKSWVPKSASVKDIRVYSRSSAEAPCKPSTVEDGSRYIVFGHYDSKQNYLLADICMDIHLSPPSGGDLRKSIIALQGDPHNN